MKSEHIKIDDISPNPLNQRTRMSKKDVKELANSINLESSGSDILIKDGQVINGHLRLMAGLDAGLKVKVKDLATGTIYYAEQNEDKSISISPYEEPVNRPRRPGPR